MGFERRLTRNADNSAAIEWGGFGIVTSAQSDTDGATNTATIVSSLGNNGGTPYAAQLCDDYEVDSQDNTPCQVGNTCYNDWFLPAKDSLDCLFTNRIAIGGFASDFYYSSTEFAGLPAFQAWIQAFNDGSQVSSMKSNLLRVRCVRGVVP